MLVPATPTRLDVGLVLPNAEPTERLRPAESFDHGLPWDASPPVEAKPACGTRELAVADEGEEEQPERQQEGHEPSLDQHVLDALGEPAASGHY